MKVFFDDDLGLTVQPEGIFDQSLHAPLTAHLAEHLFLWSKITLDFRYIRDIDEKGIRVLRLLKEKVQAPNQAILITNINTLTYQKMLGFNLANSFVLEAMTAVKTA